ncbi:MAG: ABC transporter ATP-binding protein/permease [Planctomycetes bacterium]|nr:ABC transporter ATP-binding protein/permease [Planctomycetota bacterium]
MELAEDEVLGKAYDARLMRRLLHWVRPYRALLAFSAVTLLSFSFLDLLPAEMIKRAIDGPVARWREIGRDEAVGQLLDLSLLFLGAVLVSLVARGAHSIIVEWIGQRVMVDLRRELFAKIQRLALRFFDRNPVGRLVTRVVNDVESLYQALSAGIVSIFGDVVKIAAILGFLLWLNAALALWIFLVMPPLFVLSLRFRRRQRQAYRDVRMEIARVNSRLQESITGVAVIRTFSREDRSREEFGALSEGLYTAHVRTVFGFSWFFPAVEFLFAIAQGVLIWAGSKCVAGATLTPGEFVQFWFYINLVFEPIRDLTEQYNVMQSAMASSERIFRILDEPEEVPNQLDPVPISAAAMRGEIEFDRVSFAYEGENFVLRDLSFRVAPGESVALVGATGAGKTSIISLVSRLYDPQRGSVRLDGRDLREYDKYALRSNIAVVLQDVFLFAGNVLENIRLSHADIPEERVVAAAEAVGADRFLARRPGGYRAEVLERGATFSTGEKQLLAFARALAFDPKVLILDEATSSVDSETEAMIEEALRRLLPGRTSLIIAHRLSTIRRCDRILVLHRGEVKEQGTHEELMAKAGLYRRLYELQYAAGPPGLPGRTASFSLD